MADSHNPTKYSVNSRLAQLENTVIELRAQINCVKAQKGDAGCAGRDGARGLTGAPGRNGVDGKPGKDAVGIQGPQGLPGASIQGPRGARGDKGETGPAGRNGNDSTVPGPKGDRGEPGSVLFIGPDEVQAQVQILRQQLVKWQSALLFAAEQNSKTKHSGLRAAIAGVLKQIEKNAQ